MTEVRTLGPGFSFGEVALIENKSRSATVVCKEESIFGELSKKDFYKILCTLIFIYFVKALNRISWAWKNYKRDWFF